MTDINVMEKKNINIDRTCHWCGAQTPAAFPICQKCSRHKKSWLSYAPVAGVAVSLLLIGLAITFYVDAQIKQNLAQQSLDDINKTLTDVKKALDNAQTASSASSEALAKAQQVLSIAESATATLANFQNNKAMETNPSTTVPLTMAPSTEQVSIAPKKTKARTTTTAQRIKVGNTPKQRPQVKQLVIRAPDNLIRELEKARRELALQNKEFDARNGELRFLSSTQEYENSRSLHTQSIRNTISRLEKELRAGH